MLASHLDPLGVAVVLHCLRNTTDMSGTATPAGLPFRELKTPNEGEIPALLIIKDQRITLESRDGSGINIQVYYHT